MSNSYLSTQIDASDDYSLDPTSIKSKPAYEFSAYTVEDTSKPKKNSWHQLLESVKTRKDITQGHILVLGDKGCGKRTLFKQINKPFMKYMQ